MDAEELFPESAKEWLAAHGAGGLLSQHEVVSMKRASARILALIADKEWHSANAVRMAAGRNGIPASEGLRRLRDLRKVVGPYGLEIEKQRFNDSRMYYYRLRKIVPAEDS